MKNSSLRWGFAAAVLLALAGCESPPLVGSGTGGAPVESRSVSGEAPGYGGVSATASATPQSRVATVDLAGQAVAPGGAAAASADNATRAALALPSQRVLYFDFDSYVVKDDYQGLLSAHAKALAAARGRHMVVEGHTDERGGREYNLALGQRRAEAVVKALTLLGAPAARLEATSFGEERPAVQGSDEAAWAKNRRAELKDR